MALESLFSFGVFGVAALAVLWKYSALPEIDWQWIVSGTMFLFVGGFLEVLHGAIRTWQTVSQMSQVIAVVNLIGAILIILGGLKNAIEHLEL